jgi:hypothetical protein
MPGPNAEGGIHYILDTTKFPVIGEVSFACSTTEYLWQVPAGITSITAILIGGGAGGGAGSNQTERPGGGGGGLRWVNGLVVQPGEILRIKAGVGGTSLNSLQLVGVTQGVFWNRPGNHSYIASDNNASVPARAGIGGTIIVRAEGGGWDGYVSETQRLIVELDNARNVVPGGTTAVVTEGSLQGALPGQLAFSDTVGIGTSGGQGTTIGQYPWGTVGGGNGGAGGQGGGNGGGQGGGGGGAGGYNGVGGQGGQDANNSTNVSRILPRDGTFGGGGGGMFGSGGGGNSGGGGGGTGVFWGIGPNGKNARYSSDGTTVQDGNVLGDSNVYSFAGQGGSFGSDGRATGSQVDDYATYAVTTNLQHSNNSNGDGKRGYNASLEAPLDAERVRGDGGNYGGGGGGCDGNNTDTPRSGGGGCGHVRILFVARNQFIVREYGSGRTSTQQKTINGQTVTVQYYDFNPNLSIGANQTNLWPSWSPQPGPGNYYNLLVNWGDTFGVIPPNTLAHLPAAVGINTNPNNRTF